MDNIGFSQDDFDRDDAADALREMLVSGEYAEMFQSLKNDPELAKEMEKSLSASGMSWDDLKDSLDQMAKTGGPPPQGSAGRAGSSAGMQGSGSAKPSAGTSKGTVPKPTSSRPPGSIVVAPIPALVVKSVNNIATKKYAAGVKVFINLCHSPEMFAPPPLGSMPIEEVLKKPEDFDYRVPIAVGIPRAGLDKAGKSCVEIDACLHSSVIEMAEKDLEYQTFLVELVAEMVEEQLGLALSRGKSLSSGFPRTLTHCRPFRQIFRFLK